MNYNTKNIAIIAIKEEIKRTIDYLVKNGHDDYYEKYLYQLNEAYNDLIGCDNQDYKQYQDNKHSFYISSPR